MLTHKRIAVVGSREFKNYNQLDAELKRRVGENDTLVSGGAVGVDSMAQRWAKEHGKVIQIHYPNYARYARGATFQRNEQIVRNADLVIAFYQYGRVKQGGTANTAGWAEKLGVDLIEIEEIPLSTYTAEQHVEKLSVGASTSEGTK